MCPKKCSIKRCSKNCSLCQVKRRYATKCHFPILYNCQDQSHWYLLHQHHHILCLLLPIHHHHHQHDYNQEVWSGRKSVVCRGRFRFWILRHGVWNNGKVKITFAIALVISVNMSLAFLWLPLLPRQVPVADPHCDLQQLWHLLRLRQRGPCKQSCDPLPRAVTCVPNCSPYFRFTTKWSVTTSQELLRQPQPFCPR